jgi:hypothetical protein
MPGRWMGSVNDPLDVEELEMLGSQGYIEEDLEDENDQN